MKNLSKLIFIFLFICLIISCSQNNQNVTNINIAKTLIKIAKKKYIAHIIGTKEAIAQILEPTAFINVI